MNADAAAEYAEALENCRGRCRLEPPKVAVAVAAPPVLGAESHVLCFFKFKRCLVAERVVLPLPLLDDRTLTVAPSLVSTLKLEVRILSVMGLRAAALFTRRSPGLRRLPLESSPPEAEDLIEPRDTGRSR